MLTITLIWTAFGLVVWAFLLGLQFGGGGFRRLADHYDNDTSQIASSLTRGFLLAVVLWPLALWINRELLWSIV